MKEKPAPIAGAESPRLGDDCVIVQYAFDYSTLQREEGETSEAADAVQAQILKWCMQDRIYRTERDSDVDAASHCKCIPKQLQGKDQQLLTDTFPPYGLHERVKIHTTVAGVRYVFSCLATTRLLDGYCVKMVIELDLEAQSPSRSGRS
jgi:hypothetical protein